MQAQSLSDSYKNYLNRHNIDMKWFYDPASVSGNGIVATNNNEFSVKLFGIELAPKETKRIGIDQSANLPLMLERI